MSNGSENTPERDHTGEPMVWCVTHQHQHIARIPRFTFLCKDCGWGQWYGDQAREHEEWARQHLGIRHNTYEVEHLTVPLDARDARTFAFEAMRTRIAALEAVITAAREFDGQQTVNGVTDRGYLSPEEWREGQIAAILDATTTVTLDEMIREKQARAVEDARDAIMPPVNWNLRPDGTEQPGTQHTDEALFFIHQDLTKIAEEIRSGVRHG